MKQKKNVLRILFRLLFWVSYIYAGLILYTNNIYIFQFSISFLKVIYPLSIFWIQIRLNKKEKWIPLNPEMSTSQLWFRLLPVMFSLFTAIFVSLNFILFILFKIF